MSLRGNLRKVRNDVSDFSNFLDVQTKTAWGRTLAEFASFCNPGPATIILDVGCGPGLLPALLAERGCKSYGVDFDFSLLSSGIIPTLAQAEALSLPFQSATFNLVTATNLLFLLDDPVRALREWKRVLAPGGALCLLNPSENLSVPAASRLADERRLEGTARESLLNWAQNAETHSRWTEDETRELISRAGFRLEDSVLKVGPGFARFARADFIDTPPLCGIIPRAAP
jgi:ubiquinone/menaquinone biosynthesis C-methylase UbiE